MLAAVSDRQSGVSKTGPVDEIFAVERPGQQQ
jgi:hypothetical protein